MADHAKPTVSSAYADFVNELSARFVDLAKQLDPAKTTVTNPPTDAIRWNSSGKTWERFNGSSWVSLSVSYNININGTVGATTPMSGAFTTLPSNGSPVATVGKQTVWIPASAMTPRLTNGPSVGLVEVGTTVIVAKTLDFDAAAIEEAQFIMTLPKSWDEGQITAKAFRSHAATTTNFGVNWYVAVAAISNDDTLDVLGDRYHLIDTGGTTNDLYITSETDPFTINGSPAEGDLCLVRVGRYTAGAADTLAVDARLHGIQLFFTTNAGNDN
jgi:hypothetical protein